MVIYRVGDLLPSLTIQVVDGSTVPNLSTLDVWVRWQKPDGSLIAERQANVQGDGSTGLADYVWLVGDLDQVGLYTAIIQLSPDGQPTTRYSLTNPPLVEIEVLSDDFLAIDQALPLPTPSGAEVAALLQQNVGDLDGNRLVMAIARGKTLAYSYAELWRCPALQLDPIGQRMARELISILAAQSYLTNPLVIYGPYKKEVFGSYSYEMKEGNLLTTKQQSGGKTGIPAADSIVSYLMWACRGCDPNIGGVEIFFPEWTQPVTTTPIDPSIPLGNSPPNV